MPLETFIVEYLHPHAGWLTDADLLFVRKEDAYAEKIRLEAYFMNKGLNYSTRVREADL